LLQTKKEEEEEEEENKRKEDFLSTQNLSSRQTDAVANKGSAR
jgi:hypothetical protein